MAGKVSLAPPNHLRYACRDRDYDSKKHYVFCLKTTLLTHIRTFCLTDGREWVLGSWVHDQFIPVPFVISIGHGLDGGHGFWAGGWWLGVDSLLGVGFHQLLVKLLGQLLMLLGLLFSGLARR